MKKAKRTSKLNSFYVYFYKTGQIRKIQANDLSEAQKFADDNFEKPFKVGNLVKDGQKSLTPVI